MDRVDDRVFYRNLKKSYPVVDRGEGVYIYDTQGKQYIDGSGGPAVSIVWGAKPKAASQLSSICHT
jgi:acetylornithine/succinyldiaminopimelate/putrescine aminotransferase